MKILAFRHAPFEGAGLIAAALEERGISLDYADLYCPAAPAPSIASYDGLISLGGPMSANDPLPFLDLERQLISQAIAARQPLLGICLGSQLIARALGADVHRNPVKEIGWFDVRFTPAASTDPLFSSLAAPESIFHWHSDTWDLPPGATLLASSDACPNQAFRAGPHIYGFQFHLEVTPAMIADWQLQDENCGDVRELPAPIDPHHNAPHLAVLSSLIFGRWTGSL
ncbi:MAG: type 1 glutamine amidotransferase [Bryobacteraceae bacterium]